MDGLSFTDSPIDSHGGGGGDIEFILSENIFQKFLDKLMVRKNGLGVGIFFPENSIALLRVNWYFSYLQGQKNEICSTRGGTSINMSLGIRITCGMPRCNGSEGSEIHTRSVKKARCGSIT